MNQADIFRYVVAGVMCVVLFGSLALVAVAPRRPERRNK